MTPPPPSITDKRLSRRADLRIRWWLFVALIRRVFGHGTQTVAVFLVWRALPLALVLMIAVGGTWWGMERVGQGQRFAFLQRAFAHQDTLARARERSVVFERLIIEEGRDKAEYIAMTEGVPLNDALRVPKRSEEIDFWVYGDHQKTEVHSHLPGSPGHARLFYAANGHLHVFADVPTGCSGAWSSGDGCRAAAQMDPQVKAHRALFDKVHNLAALYRFAEQYAAALPTLPADLIPVRMNASEAVYERSPSPSVVEEYTFDAVRATLVQVRTFVLHDGRRYEMAVVRYADEQVLPVAEAGTIFDPKERPYVQQAVIPMGGGRL